MIDYYNFNRCLKHGKKNKNFKKTNNKRSVKK